MNHYINFKNCSNDWHNALPLGNGNMGAMAFYRNGELSFAMNHYEIYYRIHERYSRKFLEHAAAGDYPYYEGPSYKELECLADKKYKNWREEAINQYFESLHNSMQSYGSLYRGVSHPPTGELKLCFADMLKDPEEALLQLDIEGAEALFKAKNGTENVEVTTYVSASNDYMITNVSQSSPGAISSIILQYPQRRLHEGYDCKLYKLDDHLAYYTVSFYPPGEDSLKYHAYQFVVVVKLIGPSGSIQLQDNEIQFKLTGKERNFHIITAVFGDMDSSLSIDQALRSLPDSKSGLALLCEKHHTRWDAFWSKSSIKLPDRFLETLWYMNLYSLECSSGKGGKMYEQASGLSGLWDVRQPTVWGSTWYWDINIEASYWPVYTANHPELGKVFCDGFLSYGQMAERFARDVYGVDGWAMDYPHHLYNCIAPWCAQYLWWQYEYSGDLVFLKEKAYPCFKRIIHFIRNIVKYDDQQQRYYFYPDISPEQGPLTRNSVITLASVKYLLEFTIRAGELLGEGREMLEDYRELLDGLPAYPLGYDGEKLRLRDSEHAPEDLWLRHPSLLMPIYPIGEISRSSDDEVRKIGLNTLDYVVDNTEIGVFGFGWLSCAASRLGEGARALRLLYEKGIDYILRSNGLGYEETERWINYCCIDQQPLYYPPMMEASGEITAAINEMLLQSFDGVLAVFPAIPDGRCEPERERNVYEHEKRDRFTLYKAWDNCRFDRLLAKGGFEVSSELRENKTEWVLIKSLYGNTVKVRNCFLKPRLYAKGQNGWKDLAFEECEGVISFPTDKNQSYLLCDNGEPDITYAGDEAGDKARDKAVGAVVLVHEAHTHRRVFLGEDENTEFIKRLDGFLFEYCMGNTRYSPMTVYKFDFGLPENRLVKDYSSIVHRQSITTERQMSLAQTFIRIDSSTIYSTALGFGFSKLGKPCCLKHEDRQVPDSIRRDFVCGEEPAEFKVELPKGKYDMLVISGDAGEPTCTDIVLQPAGLSLKGSILRKGRYQCRVLPFILNEDDTIILVFSSEAGLRWAVNAIIINKDYSLL